jgi:hypothetical protein
MQSPSRLSRVLSWLQARWRSLSRWQRLSVGLAFVTALLVSSTLLLVLDRGREDECSPRFCAQLLGPEGGDVDPMTPIRIRLQGVDQAAALEALTISHQPKGTKRVRRRLAGLPAGVARPGPRRQL